MANFQGLWQLIMETYRSRGAAIRKIHGMLPIQQLTAEFGEHGTDLLYYCQNYNSQALSAAHYMVRNCYDQADAIEAVLIEFADHGFVEKVEAENYRLTANGRDAFQRLEAVLRPRLEIPLLPTEVMDQLVVLLQKVADSVVNIPEPPLHWSVDTRARYGFKVAADAHVLKRLDELIFDLWAYRDDVHLAAWQPHQIEPRTWEAFSHFWTGEADTVAKLAEILAHRGFSADDYQASVDELIERGWVQVDENAIVHLTDRGTLLRQEAEDLTDQYFYVPWSVLSAAEISDLRDLLTRLRDHYQALAA